jgi:predicted RNase H-like nuclease
MAKIRQVDVALLDRPKTAARPRELSPKAQARLAQHRQFMQMISKIKSPETVFEVRLDADEKALTVRQRLMKAAEDAGREIVVRKSEKGWLIGMATPERRSRRGRRRANAA